MPNVKAPTRNQLREICNNDSDAIRSLEQLFYAAGYLLNVRTIDDDYQLTQDDFIVLADATSGAITVSTPIVSTMVNRRFFIKRLNSGGNAVTFNPFGSETIEGAATLVLSSQYDGAWVVNDGENWFIAGSV